MQQSCKNISCICGLIKGVTETIENEARKQKGGFFGMVLGTLSASLLGNLWTSKGTIRAGKNF